MKESKLIKHYIVNNKLEIEKVMSDFAPYIYVIVKNRSTNLNEEDIEEIVSDVFLAIWKNQHKLDIDKEIKLYLSGITKNIVSKRLRKFKINDDISMFENTLYDEKSIEIETENIEIDNLIIKEINKMKIQDKTIFISYYYYSKNINEISKQLDISTGKVKSRLFRIRRKLKKNLEKGGYSYNG